MTRRPKQNAKKAKAEATPTPQPNRAARRSRRAEDARQPGEGFVSDDAQAAYRRSSTLGGPTAKHISAARAAAGRRVQAKRDGR